MKLLVACTLACVSLLSHAQSYPSRPVRVVVTAPPGGSDDFMGRLLAQRLSESLNRRFVVENRPGGGALIGREYVARSAPDGYTLLMAGSAMAALPALRPNVKLDLLRDFQPISLFATYPLLLVVHPSVPARTAKELIALAKAQPGKLNFASSGTGQGPHLAGELFKSIARIDIVHVPYQGSGPAYVGIMSGQVDMNFGVIAAALQQVKSGKVRAIGVTSLRRTTAAPQIPSIAETGLPGYDFPSWMGVYGPAGMPREVVALLNAEIQKMMGAAEVKKVMLDSGLEPASSSPQQLEQMLAANIQKLGKIIHDAGIRIE
ncbi:MAG TPA: tripartite tricarboxylate transporter substrate binding protein [Burkholderiales bacterium]|nr:tripartite tricarboxylate transporter substrate binding protein [Burkholderiales bacterium]